MSTIDWKALAAPFAAHEVQWRAGAAMKDGSRCILLAYIDARAVMDRLDAVVGPSRWRNSYAAGPGGGVLCRLEILDGDQWVWREDGAENTDVESVKGGLSDALKRAAVQWGIGRYLYGLPADWHDVQKGHAPANGISVQVKVDGRRAYGWCHRPTLPPWALPGTPEQDEQRGHSASAAYAQPRSAQELPPQAKLEAAMVRAGVTREQLDLYLAAHDRPASATLDAAAIHQTVDWLGRKGTGDRIRDTWESTS